MRTNRTIRKKIFFMVWTIEAYKNAKGISGTEANAIFKKHQLKKWLFDNYDVLHTVSTEYVLKEIEDIIRMDNNGNTCRP